MMARQDRSPLRVSPGREGVSIWSQDLFADVDGARARAFLSRAFAIAEVASVEIRPGEFFGRVHYPQAPSAADIWRRLAVALKGSAASDAALPSADAGALHLSWPEAARITVHRVDGALTTWKPRLAEGGRLRLFHPALRNRPDLAFRLEEDLSPLVGVLRVRATPLLGELFILFDPDAIAAGALVRELERAWPRVLGQHQAPPPVRRLVAAASLFGVALVGQYFVPVLYPVALLGVLLYGLPNLIAALRQLKSERVGLPAMYASALMLALARARPFQTSIMAIVLQLWPRIIFHTFSSRQRRLFAGVRRRAATARIRTADGAEVSLDMDAVEPGDLVVVRAGEIIPVDGIVAEGLATVDEAVLTGALGAADKGPGDRVHAATTVRDGSLVVRVERAGQETAAAAIAATLPLAGFENLPSSAQAEHVANRNAKPAIAAAAIGLLATRQLRVGQVILRPDYATAPRLSAQFAALHDIAEGLAHGFFFRDDSAIDRLAATDVFVFDDGAGLGTRRLEVAEVVAADGISADEVVALAAAAFPEGRDERGEALAEECADRAVDPPQAREHASRAAGVSLRDPQGHVVDVLTPAQFAVAKVRVPQRLARAFAASRFADAGVSAPAPAAGARRSRRRSEAPDADVLLRPLWVLRAGAVIGFITFRRRGAWDGTALIAALRARAPRARFVHISARPQAEAEDIAAKAGIFEVQGGLDAAGKAQAVRELGARTLWIGNGADKDAAEVIAAAAVSVSMAGAARVPDDKADVVVLSGGLRRLELLRRLVATHHARIDGDYRVVYGVNLSALVLGLLARLPNYSVGLVSSAAGAFILARYRRQLDALASRLDAREQDWAAVLDGRSTFEGFDAPEPENVELPADSATVQAEVAEGAELGDTGAV